MTDGSCLKIIFKPFAEIAGNKWEGLFYDVKTDQDLADYILGTNDFRMAKSRCIWIRAMKPNAFSPHLLNNLELHMTMKYGDISDVPKFISECMQEVGAGFWPEFALYTAMYLFQQKFMQHCDFFRKGYQMKTRGEVLDLFSHVAQKFKDKELHLNIAIILLYPEMTTRLANKTFPMLLKQEYPVCFTNFIHTTTQNLGNTNVKRDDVTNLLKKWYSENFNLLSVEPPVEEVEIDKKLVDHAAHSFFDLTHQPTIAIFGKITKGHGPNPIEEFLKLPKGFTVKENSELFLQFFFSYIKLGLFDLSHGLCIANYDPFYDDRYQGDNKRKLFEKPTTLRDVKYWGKEYDEKKKKNQVAPLAHPYDRNFKVLNRFVDLVKFNEKNGLIKKFGYEEFIQYFSMALVYCNRFDRMETMFSHNKDRMETNQGYLCLYLNYIIAASKLEKTEQAAQAWMKLLEKCVELDYVKIEGPNTVDAFYNKTFIRKEYVAEYATKVFRNHLMCLINKDDAEGLKKYALLLLYIADALPENFVNFNVIQIVIDKITPELASTIFTEGWTDYISTFNTLGKIYNRLISGCPDIFKGIDVLEIASTKRNAGKIHESHRYFIGFLKKMKSCDPIFKGILPNNTPTEIPKEWDEVSDDGSIEEEEIEEEVVEKKKVEKIVWPKKRLESASSSDEDPLPEEPSQDLIVDEDYAMPDEISDTRIRMYEEIDSRTIEEQQSSYHYTNDSLNEDYDDSYAAEEDDEDDEPDVKRMRDEDED